MGPIPHIPQVNADVARFFRSEFQRAREKALQDAEAFDGVIHTLERLGKFLQPGANGLGQTQTTLHDIARCSPLADEIPQHWRILHPPFDSLFGSVRRGRNDAMHTGSRVCTYAALHDLDEIGGVAAIQSLTGRSTASIRMKIQNIAAMAYEENIPHNPRISRLTGATTGEPARRTHWDQIQGHARKSRERLRDQCWKILADHGSDRPAASVASAPPPPRPKPIGRVRVNGQAADLLERESLTEGRVRFRVVLAATGEEKVFVSPPASIEES